MDKVTSLASLKRHFQAGHGVVLVEYLYHGKPAPHRMLNVERHPDKVQTNGVYLGGSWMDYGKASQWTFDPDSDGATLDCGFALLKYRLIP